ncbi:MAG: hypothetical protein HYY01_08180 [Chloroflexi bacterium]|nr:hypothetical protein [Chloroflexota bacterium]
MPRRRRPAITTEDRARWLGDLERGRGVTAIARAEGRDIRVVKRHIELALQEREVGLARRDFIRGRLEQHQEDLLSQVGRLKEALGHGPPQPLAPGDDLKRKIHEGLKEHLQRIPVARLVSAVQTQMAGYWEVRTEMLNELRQQEQQLKSTVLETLSLHPWSDNLVRAIESWAWSGSSWERPYEARMQDEGQGYHQLWGEFSLTHQPVSQLDLGPIEQAHRALCLRATSLVAPLLERVGPLRELAARVVDELDVFVLRRVVPGRCRYCPV